jgi:hypothetical protein
VFKKNLSQAYSQRIKTGGRSNCTFQRSPTPPSLLPRGDADTPRRGAENDSGHVRPPRRGEPTPAAVKDFVGLSRPGGNSLEIKGCLPRVTKQAKEDPVAKLHAAVSIDACVSRMHCVCTQAQIILVWVWGRIVQRRYQVNEETRFVYMLVGT